MTKVSVIVPTYNVERYINQCLDSLCRQTLEDIEIIVVDDGSTDNTVELATDYARRDRRVFVIREQHENAGHARNVGLMHASGEYLSFLDSDDFFEPIMLESSLERAEETSADVVLFHANRFLEAERKYIEVPWMLSDSRFPSKAVFRPIEIEPNAFRAFVGWTWDKLFKREFIVNKKITFQEQPAFNDLLFTFSAVFLADRLTILPGKPLVHQRKRGGGSISDRKNIAYHFIEPALCELRSTLIKNGLFPRFEREFVNYALHLFDNNLTSLAGDEVAFSDFYNLLRDRLFLEFDLPLHDASYYYHQSEWDRYREIVNKPLC